MADGDPAGLGGGRARAALEGGYRASRRPPRRGLPLPQWVVAGCRGAGRQGHRLQRGTRTCPQTVDFHTAPFTASAPSGAPRPGGVPVGQEPGVQDPCLASAPWGAGAAGQGLALLSFGLPATEPPHTLGGQPEAPPSRRRLSFLFHIKP